MGYTNSPLVDYVRISPNSNNPRKSKILKITPHHMAGNLTVEQCGAIFAPASRGGSSNYGIDSNGRVGMYVEEKNRAWTSSSPENDHQAVTIEVANDVIGGNWHVSDKALAKLIDLCVDICKRNGIKKLIFTGDETGNLTMHKYFAPTACPGPYLESKFPYIAEQVNARLNPTQTTKPKTFYRVQTGAFRNKTYANNYLAKVNAAGFDTYMVKVGDLYKIQVGAFSNKKNAEALQNKLKAKGFDAFITTN